MHTPTLEEYIKILRSQGKNSFTLQSALSELNISRSAFNSRTHRLAKKGELISPAQHLYVIVPPEYRAIGSLPASELIPLLMKHLNQDYYVGLLSAALYHGASHQKPQIFQVMVTQQMRALTIGKVRIEFLVKKTFDNLTFQNITVKTGYLKISSPEVTTMDLLLYINRAGGLNAIATILSELVESIDPKKLISLAKNLNGKSWVQRLGWILDKIETEDDKHKEKLIGRLLHYLDSQRIFYIPITNELESAGYPRNKKWKIIENTSVESDNDT